MRAHFRPSDLIPAELNVEAVRHRPDVIVVVVACVSPELQVSRMRYDLRARS